MTGFYPLDPSSRHAVTVPGGGDAQKPRGRQAQLVEIMALDGCGHRRCGLARGETDHPLARQRPQVRREHAVGMRRANGGIENRAQQRTSVDHGFTAARWNTGPPLSARWRKKKTPAK